MDYKYKLFLLGLIVIMFLNICVVAAQENSTDIISNDEISTNVELSSSENFLTLENFCKDDSKLNMHDDKNDNPLSMAGTFYSDDEIVDQFGDSIIISTNNLTTTYKSNEKVPIKFVVASSGKPLSNYPVEVEIYEYLDKWSSSGESFYGNTNEEGIFYVSLKNLWAGEFFVSAKILLNSNEEWGFYSNDFAKITIKKASTILLTYKLFGTTKSSLLTAIVKDKNGKKINEGKVKFTINGKSYTANVKNGIATKTINLPYAKTYKYTAEFYSNNYQTKSSSSKIIVKPTKNYYTFKCGNLVGKISYKQYSNILNEYNKGNYKEITVNTGKYNTYKVPTYKTVKVTKEVWEYRKVLYYKDVYSSDWSDSTTTYYDVDKYYNNGWTFYGSTYVEENDGHVHKVYQKFKKKVKVTETKKVKNGYKYEKYPIKMVVSSTEGYNGFSIEFYDSHKGYLGGGLKNSI